MRWRRNMMNGKLPETVERPFPELDCSPRLDVRDFVALRRIRTKFRAVDPECEYIHNDPGFGCRYDWVVSPVTTKSRGAAMNGRRVAGHAALSAR
jgi:hypothetical protein